MSTYTDIGRSTGISAHVADVARAKILATSNTRDDAKPVTFLSHTRETRSAANEFLQNGDKSEIARILGIPTSEVQKRFRGNQPGIFNHPQYRVTAGRTDLAYTILALGDLSYENGLPTLGSAHNKHTLKSGEALHFMGDLEQVYGGAGGGVLIWFHWSCLP